MGLSIGILALQGAFAEHEAVLLRLGAEPFLIRQLSDIDRPMDGLILPGGESTVQGKLLRELGLFAPLKKKMEAGMPAYGTCAGMILLAKALTEDPEHYFSVMDIEVRRNAYGRQLGSFLTRAPFGEEGEVSMPFIRAPYVEKAAPQVEILSRVDGRIVAVRQGNLLGTSFHPELTMENTVHQYFLRMAEKAMRGRKPLQSH